MKFTIEKARPCGGRYAFPAYGGADFGAAIYPGCGKPSHLVNPLSVSVTAERLFYRSKTELERRGHPLEFQRSWRIPDAG